MSHLFLVIRDDDPDCIKFADWLRKQVPRPALDLTSYESLDGLLYDYARQEGPWDPDPTKNVQIPGHGPLPWASDT